MSTGCLTLARKVPSPFCDTTKESRRHVRIICRPCRGRPVSHRDFQDVMLQQSVQSPDVLRLRVTPGVTPYESVTPNLSSNDGLSCKGRFPEGAPGSSREADTAGAGPPPLAAPASRRLERRVDLEQAGGGRASAHPDRHDRNEKCLAQNNKSVDSSLFVSCPSR
jgi:hypothetical protein